MSFGQDAVALARAVVTAEATGGPMPDIPTDGEFGRMSGAFVTLSKFPSGNLRGCIGYPMPAMRLGQAIAGAARSACHDPRFPDLRGSELDDITVEVTILTEPEIIRGEPQALKSSIVIGRDGLMIELMGHRGLLLPQVPLEWGWDAGEFLKELCCKAGLPEDAWMHPDAKILSFQGEIWSEDAPKAPAVGGSHERHRSGCRGQSSNRRRAQIRPDRYHRGWEDSRRRELCIRGRETGGFGDQQDNGPRLHRSACAHARPGHDIQGGFRDRDAIRRACGRDMRSRHA